jgi:hypothetical protein
VDLETNEQFRQECLDQQVPSRVAPNDFCSPEQTRDDIQLEWYLDKAPFDFVSSGADGALAFAGISAVIAALIGATWIGVEWSTRSLVALLFWAPRRMQVMTAKLRRDPDANGFVEPKEYFLGPLQSGIYLGTVTIVVVAIGAVLFARRDLH